MDQIIKEVKEAFDKSTHLAHDFDHIERVAKLATYIAKGEGYDTKIATITAYLHDIGRTIQKEEKGHGPAGVETSKKLLDKYTTYDESTKELMLNAVRDHSAFTTEDKLSNIIQDADRLDGLGVLGLARAYVSKSHLPIFNPNNIIPTEGKPHSTIHEAIAFQMEWYDMLHTETAKKIAKSRYERMQQFLKDFEQEALGLDYK